jgi:diguanylate cyclase (GGDEF)-like protein
MQGIAGLNAEDNPGPYPLQLLLLTLLYFLTGIIGLAVQTVPSGITPIWPASGIAFAALYIYGLRLWPAIILGMVSLSFYADVPLVIALIAGAGSVLEAVIPILILRRLNFDGDLNRVHSIFLFVSVAVVLGPVFSASLGSLAFNWLMPMGISEVLRIWAYWWLGNGIGILIVGSFLLIWLATPNSGKKGELPGKLFILIATAAAMFLSLAINQHPYSTLIMFLLIPFAVLAAMRYGLRCVSTMALVTMIVTLITGAWLIPEAFKNAEIGTIYLNIAFLVIITSTGLLVSAANYERIHHQIMKYRATIDALTGLGNRHEFLHQLERTLLNLRRRDDIHSLMYIDLDGLKLVNDTSGHAAGDEVLKKIGQVFQRVTRNQDVVGRLGGDEFAILLRNCNTKDALAIAEEIRKDVVAEIIEWQKEQYRVTASIGIVRIDKDHDHADKIIEQADTACYTSKRAGGDQITLGN